MSFIELFDFIIYQHLNKRTKILSLVTSQIAHSGKQFNHVCTANFYATFQKHCFFVKIALKLRYLSKKCKIFDPRVSGGWGLCPQTPSLLRLGASPPDPHWPPAAGTQPPDPQNSSSALRISGYAPGQMD